MHQLNRKQDTSEVQYIGIELVRSGSIFLRALYGQNYV
jgi:hypothetical protein